MLLTLIVATFSAATMFITGYIIGLHRGYSAGIEDAKVVLRNLTTFFRDMDEGSSK